MIDRPAGSSTSRPGIPPRPSRWSPARFVGRVLTLGAVFFVLSIAGEGRVADLFHASNEGTAVAYADAQALLTGDGAGAQPADETEGSTLRYILLVLGATASGALLAYHPLHRARVGTIEDLDLPKIFITYTLVGALVGLAVHRNHAMGLAIFGMGSLMRFRTILSTAKETGRLILSTVVGLAWGYGDWEVAAAATAVSWLLVLVLDWRVAYRVLIRGVTAENLVASSDAYGARLTELGCTLSQVKRNPKKEQLAIVFKASRKHSREDLESAFDAIDPELRGTFEWSEEA